jgi:hypothetical protein
MESIGPLLATAFRELGRGIAPTASQQAGRKVHGGIRQRANTSDPVACRSVRSLAVISSVDATDQISPSAPMSAWVNNEPEGMSALSPFSRQ